MARRSGGPGTGWGHRSYSFTAAGAALDYTELSLALGTAVNVFALGRRGYGQLACHAILTSTWGSPARSRPRSRSVPRWSRRSWALVNSRRARYCGSSLRPRCPGRSVLLLYAGKPTGMAGSTGGCNGPAMMAGCNP